MFNYQLQKCVVSFMICSMVLYDTHHPRYRRVHTTVYDIQIVMSVFKINKIFFLNDRRLKFLRDVCYSFSLHQCYVCVALINSIPFSYMTMTKNKSVEQIVLSFSFKSSSISVFISYVNLMSCCIYPSCIHV